MKILIAVRCYNISEHIRISPHYVYNPDECSTTIMDDLKGDIYLVTYNGDNRPTIEDLDNFLLDHDIKGE